MNEILDEHLNPPSGQHVEYAGFWIRVGATLIDGIILSPIAILSIYNVLEIKSMALMIILSLLSFCYKPIMEWQQSATLGKKFLGLKLVDSSFHNISREQAFNRYAPWIISFILNMSINLSLFNSDDFINIKGLIQMGEFVQNLPLNNLNSIFNFVFMLILGSVAFDTHKQGLHDKYAGTFCVITNSLK